MFFDGAERERFSFRHYGDNSATKIFFAKEAYAKHVIKMFTCQLLYLCHYSTSDRICQHFSQKSRFGQFLAMLEMLKIKRVVVDIGKYDCMLEN